MISNMTKDAATSSVLTHWTGEAVVARRTVPPIQELDGTGLPIAGTTDAGFAGSGIGLAVMTDQVQGVGVVGGVAVQGIPPRWRPVRC